MSTSSTIELDFFAMEKKAASNSKSFRRRSNLRGIQSAISKLNPELLKSVLNSSNLNNESPSSETTSPKEHNYNAFPMLPRTNVEKMTSKTAPLTIFYNGQVVISDVPPEKAENILKIAAEGSYKNKKIESDKPNIVVTNPSSDKQQLVEALTGDLPLARKKSLQKFLEKRKERLTFASPYAYRGDYAFLKLKMEVDALVFS